MTELALRQLALPEFTVELAPPEILPAWRAGDEVPGFISRTGPVPGPHVVLVSLVHGNELAGAIAVAELLRAGLRPARGRLTMGFANLAAFDSFDPGQPTASRFIDEDLNRVWDAATLESGRAGIEVARAREMRPLIDSADVLLDLHSMLWPSEPLLLSGASARGAALARQLGTPALAVADDGHASGRRLIDYARFATGGEAVAVLVEAGQHWAAETVPQTRATVAALLARMGMAGPSAQPSIAVGGRFARVTQAITASTSGFAFVHPFRGGDVVAHQGTLIALDGDAKIRTPHDDCLLVMPSLRTGRGHTAVRLARFEP